MKKPNLQKSAGVPKDKSNRVDLFPKKKENLGKPWDITLTTKFILIFKLHE